MARTFIAELNRELSPKMLRIWERRAAADLTDTERGHIATLRGERSKGFLAKDEPLVAIPECANLGPATGEIVTCASCGDGRKIKTFACSIYGTCTTGIKAVTGVPGCCNGGKCPSYLPPLKSDPIEDNRYQQEADEFLKDLEPYPEGRYRGRGITIAAGGSYWPSAYVTVRMIRHVGCTLPIQVWYLGANGERDERYERLLAPLGVEFIDIDVHPERPQRRGVKGFQTKLFAAVHSPFEEVLSLDPDNYPCVDPTVLFDDLRYKTLGAIYWPDGPQTGVWTNWRMFGVSPRGPCGLETGQYVLNKRIVWEPMNLAEWYDDRPEWTYGKVKNGGTGPNDLVSGGDYGDKGPPRAAFAKLQRDYVVFNSLVNWCKVAFVQVGPDGHSPMFIHRSRSKFVLDGESFATTRQTGRNVRAGLPGEDAAFGFLDELRMALATSLSPA